MTDPKPMTPELKPLTKEEREAMVAAASEFFTLNAQLSAEEMDDAYPVSYARHSLALRIESTLSAKEAECEALREAVTQDRERLDWLEANCPTDRDAGEKVWLMGDRESGRLNPHGETLREAIDAARRPSPEDTKP